MDTISRLLERLSTEPNAPVQDPAPVQSNGNGNGGNGVHHHRRRPQFRNGARQAACRAFAGARFVLDYGISIADASRWTGSNLNYVVALLAVMGLHLWQNYRSAGNITTDGVRTRHTVTFGVTVMFLVTVVTLDEVIVRIAHGLS